MTRPDALSGHGQDLQNNNPLLQPSTRERRSLSRRKSLLLAGAGLGIAASLVFAPEEGKHLLRQALGFSGQTISFSEGAEIIPRPPNPIYFVDSLGRQVEWLFDDMQPGRPPNSPRRIGTIFPTIDGVPAPLFQLLQSLYPEIARGPGVYILINGMIADMPTPKAFLATAVMISDDGVNCRPYVEIIADKNNPWDYSPGARIRFGDGLPITGSTGYGDVYSSFSWGVDTSGTFIVAGIKNSILPEDDGIYRLRLDSNYNPLGQFEKQAVISLTPTAVSTATITATPTVVPTITPVSLRYKAPVLGVERNTR